MSSNFGASTQALLGMVVPIGMIAVWAITASLNWIPEAVLASPPDVALSLIALLGNSRFHHDIFISLFRLSVGTAIAAVLGAFVGTLIAMSPTARRLVSLPISLAAPVPPVLYTPLLIVSLGLGNASKIALIALGGFFIATVHSSAAAGQIEMEMRRFSIIYRLSLLQRLRHLAFPAVLTELFSALRIMVSLGWVLLLAAELIASSDGLGWFINDARNFGRIAEMYAATIIVAALGFASDFLLVSLKRAFAPWSREVQ